MFCFSWDVHAIFHMMSWKGHISWRQWWICLPFLDLVWDGRRIGLTSHQCWSGWPVFRTHLLVSTRHAWGACCVRGPAQCFSYIFAWRSWIHLGKVHLGNLIVSICNWLWRLGWWLTENVSQMMHSCWCIHQMFSYWVPTKLLWWLCHWHIRIPRSSRLVALDSAGLDIVFACSWYL